MYAVPNEQDKLKQEYITNLTLKYFHSMATQSMIAKNLLLTLLAILIKNSNPAK